MTGNSPACFLRAATAALLMAGCASGGRAPVATAPEPTAPPAATAVTPPPTQPPVQTGTGTQMDKAELDRIAALILARNDSSIYPHTPADVEFMQGMIPHHAQAVLMAGWAETNAERRDVKVLAERIILGQKNEIRIMRNWLRVRGEMVPDSNATHMRMTMPGGMQHDMLMPGMLTDAELEQLKAARGKEFDRLFLTFMIKHHEGAVGMVDKLTSSPGAGMNETVFRLSTDIHADQTTEIARMQTMLESIPPGAARQ